MISAGSLARDKQSGQLIYVCNDEGAPSKGRDDPSRILGIETIDPKMPCKEPQLSECFEADLAEVTEAHGTERQTVCAHYDCMVIENHWTEDTPMERYYRIWTLRESDRASIWLQRGYFSRFELLRGLSATNTVVLAHAIQESHLFEWGRKIRKQERPRMDDRWKRMEHNAHSRQFESQHRGIGRVPSHAGRSLQEPEKTRCTSEVPRKQGS